jgi:hypothetical protein
MNRISGNIFRLCECSTQEIKAGNAQNTYYYAYISAPSDWYQASKILRCWAGTKEWKGTGNEEHRMTRLSCRKEQGRATQQDGRLAQYDSCLEVWN